MPRTIAIGDIHGYATALAKLIKVVTPQIDDTDRALDSRGVIEQSYSW